MKRLQVKNTGESTVVLKDQEGYTEFAMTVAKNDTEVRDVTDDLMERLETQLNALVNSTDANVSMEWAVFGQTLLAAAGSTINLWIDGTNGDDTKDGESLSTAVKTLARLNELMPEEPAGPIIINARGTITLPTYNTPGYPTLFSTAFGAEVTNVLAVRGIGRWPFVMWDGGDEMVTHADDGGSDWTSDINTNGTIGDSGESWTPNVYRGYYVMFTSGANAGKMAVIEKNDATTLTFSNYDLGDPGAGATFRIVRWKTELTSTGPTDFHVNQQGHSSLFRFQRTYISGGVWHHAERCHPAFEWYR
jgi:hypothetical protein